MTVDKGIIVGGVLMPGSEWVVRDSAAWWSRSVPLDLPDLRLRPASISLLCGHWTGGNARTGPVAGPAVVRAMKSRKRDDGTAMSVSIHFVISWDGLCWQTCDLADVAIHAGGRVNLRSVGVECCWPGTSEQAAKLGHDGKPETRMVRGRQVRTVPPSSELAATWTRLARLLSAPETRAWSTGLVAIDRVCSRGRPPESGACEHMDVPGTTKVDAAGYLLDALRVDGWR